MAITSYGFQAHYTALSVNATGDNTLVAAVPGMKIRVVSIFVVSSGGTSSLKFQSSTTSDLTGAIVMEDQSKFDLGVSEYGHFQTEAGEALSLNLSNKVTLGGAITYFLC